MAETFLSDLQIATRYGVHRSTPWRWAKTEPGFPSPVKLGLQTTRWRLVDIEAWEAARNSA